MIGLDKIVAQVVKVDPDGVDIVCFGGNEGADWYRNVKNTKKLEEMVNDKRPSGVSYFLLINDYIYYYYIFIVFFYHYKLLTHKYMEILPSFVCNAHF